MKQETKLKEKVLKGLKLLPYCDVEKIQQVSKRGTADLFMTFLGMAFRLELKCEYDGVPDNRMYLQLRKMGRNLRALGASYIITEDNWRHHYARWKQAAKRFEEKNSNNSRETNTNLSRD